MRIVFVEAEGKFLLCPSPTCLNGSHCAGFSFDSPRCQYETKSSYGRLCYRNKHSNLQLINKTVIILDGGKCYLKKSQTFLLQRVELDDCDCLACAQNPRSLTYKMVSRLAIISVMKREEVFDGGEEFNGLNSPRPR